MKKNIYRIKNWKSYNKSLVQRGSITFWCDQEEKEFWLNKKNSPQRGRPTFYSDTAIQCMLLIKSVYRLPLRGLQGFVGSFFKMANYDLPCPDYTTVCKRAKNLKIKIPQYIKTGEAIHVLIDSTGLKIYGEGEWKTRTHGIGKRRTWRKLHVGICASTQSIVSSSLTKNNVADSKVLKKLLDGVEGSIERVYADGAYDSTSCHATCLGHKATPIIPPRRGARKSRNSKKEILKNRDAAIGMVREQGGGKEGLKAWKKLSGYHKRSLIENHFFRHKTILGVKLSSRTFCRQKVEASIKCLALNKITSLGMPKSYKVAG